jgi:beta-alanine--pyruvate transaminase
MRAYDVFVDCFFNQNLLIRTTGDIIALSPPLIISEAQIGELTERLRRGLEAVK